MCTYTYVASACAHAQRRERETERVQLGAYNWAASGKETIIAGIGMYESDLNELTDEKYRSVSSRDRCQLLWSASQTEWQSILDTAI